MKWPDDQVKRMYYGADRVCLRQKREGQPCTGGKRNDTMICSSKECL